MRAKLRLLLLATLVSTPLSAIGQETEFPTINTIGRFLGVGYSHTGYHGRRDGRFDAIERRHPASNYGSNGLLYPYDLAYRPVRPMRMPAPAAVHSTPRVAPAMPKIAPPQPAIEPEQVDTPDPTPPKPSVPPPQWLKPHLKQPDIDQKKESTPTEDEVFGELTPPRPPSSQAESPFFLEPSSPSDRPLSGPGPTDLSDDLLSDDLLEDDLLGPEDDTRGRGGDSLLDEDSGESLLDESDDDLLLLDDDDLSARRYQRPTAGEPRTATQPSLGRKVSILQGPIPPSGDPHPSTYAHSQRAELVDYQRQRQLSHTAPQPYAGQRARFTAPPRQYQHSPHSARPTSAIVRYYGLPSRPQNGAQPIAARRPTPQPGAQPQRMTQTRVASQQQMQPNGSHARFAQIPTRKAYRPAQPGTQSRPMQAPQPQPLQWQARPIVR